MNETQYEIDDQIPFHELPKVLHKVYKVRISLGTLYRWRMHGRKGVRLPVNIILGKPHVTLRQVNEFNNQLTAAQAVPKQRRATDRQVRLAHERAKRIRAQSSAKRAK